nr:MAG TPA: hypothetical protein [Caudoviricetes sp.]
MLISVVWSPFAAIYFIPIKDYIGRFYINHFGGVASPKPCMLTDRGIFRTTKTIIRLLQAVYPVSAFLLWIILVSYLFKKSKSLSHVP